MKKPTENTTSTVIEQTSGCVRIVMPMPRITFVIVFLSLWLVGWAAGEISVLRALFGLQSLLNTAALFLLVWLAGWTLGGVIAALLLAMVLDGREVVTVYPERIVRRVEAYGRGLDWNYPMESASNLRQILDSKDIGNLIAFDSGLKTIRFGTGMTEAAAEKVAEAIWAEFPQLMPPDEQVRQADEDADSAAADS